MICPSCGYKRKLDEMAPEWQCPNCQVAYNKVAHDRTLPQPKKRHPNPIIQFFSWFFSKSRLVFIAICRMIFHKYIYLPKQHHKITPKSSETNNHRNIQVKTTEKNSQQRTKFPESHQTLLSEEQQQQINERWELLGGKEALCPSCHIALSKFPIRKTKCKSCSKNIYRGSNPLTNEYILFSDNQEQIYTELLWMSDGTWQNWFDNFDEINIIRNHLSRVYGSTDPNKIPFKDIIWAKIQKNLGFWAQNGQWYSYVRELEAGIRFLNEEHNIKAALPLIYQFIYLAYNVDILSGTDMEQYIDFPKKIGSPQIYLIENFIKELENIDDFDNWYIDFITASGYPKIFGGTAQKALNQYKNEKKEYYEELSKTGHFITLDQKFLNRLKSS
ncbi:hypothetical protein Lmor_2281 [Legionella moravica]|uniref:Uncharacterized protein n=2 Tax=Legionella moravica TaxID=39962 RepID=A0A378JYF4_9GAMM|nr:hypothetical protein [Legionella moravica]KTD32343.1 hypothetical protein Lmor_2281 [Legionella moravica]STX62438.1 Uncharacterised protein [Legionella moravica]